MNTINEFAKPTRENASIWRSPEKSWFQQFSLNRLHDEDYSIYLAESPLTGKGVCLLVSFRFYVTSFRASLYIRESDCPEAFKNPYLNPSEGWGCVAESGWGANGSGFNKKYVEARSLIEATARGDWSAWSPLIQENRTTSYSFNKGENTKFWSAELTDPKLAQEQYTFPMTISPQKRIPATTPKIVDVGVVVTSKLYPELGNMEIIAKHGDLFLVERTQHSPTKSGSCEKRMIVKADQVGDPVAWSRRSDFLLQNYAAALKQGVERYYSNHFSYARNVVDPRSALD